MYIQLKNKGLTYLPDLSRFYKLKELNVSCNLLKQLPKLPPSLQEIYCGKNQIEKLPDDLPQDCYILHCHHNQITSLPKLPPMFEVLYIIDNPIYNMFDLRGDAANKVRNIIKIQKFRHIYYTLKFKNRFHKWLWRSRETKIKEKYSPANLMKLLEGVEDEEEFHSTLDAW
jgi:Leucine-rich repeat (LRR) protein